MEWKGGKRGDKGEEERARRKDRKTEAEEEGEGRISGNGVKRKKGDGRKEEGRQCADLPDLLREHPGPH